MDFTKKYKSYHFFPNLLYAIPLQFHGISGFPEIISQVILGLYDNDSQSQFALFVVVSDMLIISQVILGFRDIAVQSHGLSRFFETASQVILGFSDIPSQFQGLSGFPEMISQVILGFRDIPSQSHGLSGCSKIISQVIVG